MTNKTFIFFLFCYFCYFAMHDFLGRTQNLRVTPNFWTVVHIMGWFPPPLLFSWFWHQKLPEPNNLEIKACLQQSQSFYLAEQLRVKSTFDWYDGSVFLWSGLFQTVPSCIIKASYLKTFKGRAVSQKHPSPRIRPFKQVTYSCWK